MKLKDLRTSVASVKSAVHLTFTIILCLLFCGLALAEDTPLNYDSYKQEADAILSSFNDSFNDQQINVSEIQEITHGLGIFYLKLSREGNLTTNQKSTLLKPIAKALGDSIVKVTDPLANPVMSRQNSRGSKFEFALGWISTRFKALVRDITQVPHLKNDARITKIGKAPIDELNDLLLKEIPSLQSNEEATEVKKFFTLMVREIERSEPYRFQEQHTLMYRIYLGMALYVALIDRWDWVGLVTWDFNTWSPVYSAVSLTMVSLAFAYNRYLNSGRGVLKSYESFAATVESLDSEAPMRGKSESRIAKWIKSLPKSCSKLLGGSN